MANTKISALTANTNPNGNEEFVYAFNNANGKITLDTMKTFASAGSQATLVSGVNIKTINNQSILGSGNLDVSGGGGGSWQPTELGGDANIWELSEGVYETTYDLYYKTGEKVPVYSNGTKKQMLFVVEESTGEKGYFVFNEGHSGSTYAGRASYGYSVSSSIGLCSQLGVRDYALQMYEPYTTTTNIADFFTDGITQIVSNVAGQNYLRVNTSNTPYPGLTYTVYVESVSGTYSVSLSTGITNPLNITLPNSSTKKCVITVFMTSSTTGIVTGCTMEA